MSPQVLVTGAAGRLGTAICHLLHDSGFDFLATDVVDPGERPYPFRRADLLDHASTLDLMDGVDVVVHVGNHPGIGGAPPQVVFAENTQMNANVFQGAAQSGASRIVFASTLQLIGSHVDKRTVVNPPVAPSFPLDGNSLPQPANLYALSKTIAEQMLQFYTARCGIDCVALRLPMLHRNDGRASVNLGKETAIDIAEGFTGLTYQDAASLFLAVLRSDLPGYRAFMAGTAHRHNDLDLAGLIEAFYPNLPPDTPDLIDNSALEQELGWKISNDYDHPNRKDIEQ